jgi:hypothetical protein
MYVRILSHVSWLNYVQLHIPQRCRCVLIDATRTVRYRSDVYIHINVLLRCTHVYRSGHLGIALDARALVHSSHDGYVWWLVIYTTVYWHNGFPCYTYNAYACTITMHSWQQVPTVYIVHNIHSCIYIILAAFAQSHTYIYVQVVTHPAVLAPLVLYHSRGSCSWRPSLY